jgi:replication fork clamp-binding protein CrfC
LRQVSHQNILCYWQPLIDIDVNTRLEGIKKIKESIINIHVFNWLPYTNIRRPLEEGRDDWYSYLSTVNDNVRERFAIMEFVKDDSTEQFIRDAEILKKTVADVNSEEARNKNY